MRKNKILCIFLAISMLWVMLSITASAEEITPAAGEQRIVDITWTRTTEPNGAKSLPVAAWSWSDVEGINYGRADDVWDGGTVGGGYIGEARRPWDIATWHTSRPLWDGTADVRRFRGEFTVPEGYTVFDEITVSSVGDYSALGLYGIIPINDNIYAFVYPKGQEITDENFMEFFAFWTGTACQDAATAANGNVPITFHGIPGLEPVDYKEIAGEPIPEENLLSHTDGWYCEMAEDNIGVIMRKRPTAQAFVIDLFVDDYAEDGGMDRLNITFTKTAEEEPGGATPPTVRPPSSETPQGLIEIPDEGIPGGDMPKTGGGGTALLFAAFGASLLGMGWLFREKKR